jgi:hypothetical protein
MKTKESSFISIFVRIISIGWIIISTIAFILVLFSDISSFFVYLFMFIVIGVLPSWLLFWLSRRFLYRVKITFSQSFWARFLQIIALAWMVMISLLCFIQMLTASESFFIALIACIFFGILPSWLVWWLAAKFVSRWNISMTWESWKRSRYESGSGAAIIVEIVIGIVVGLILFLIFGTR